MVKISIKNIVIAVSLPAELVSVMSCCGGGLEANKTMQVSHASTASFMPAHKQAKKILHPLLSFSSYLQQQQCSTHNSMQQPRAVLGTSASRGACKRQHSRRQY